MAFCEKFGLLTMVTKQGILYLFEVASGTRLLTGKVSDGNVITGCKNLLTHGILLANKKG